MKFDAIIMNPPYGKLAPKILKTLVEEKVSEEIVTIQPLHQLTTIKPQGEKNRTLSNGSNINSMVDRIIVKDGNKIWEKDSAGFTVNLAIFKISCNSKSNKCIIKYDDHNITVNHISKVKYYGYHPIMDDIFSKINKFSSTMECISGIADNYNLCLSAIGPGSVSPFYKRGATGASTVCGVIPKTYTIVGRDAKVIFKKDGNNTNNKKNVPIRETFGFSSLIESKNCAEYLLSPFVRFVMSQYITDIHRGKSEYNRIPKLNFLNKVTDEIIKKSFSITDKEFNYITDWWNEFQTGIKCDWSKYD